MARAWLKCIIASMLLVAVLAAAAPSFVAAKGADDVGALNKQVEQLYRQGKFKEALALGEKALSLAERVLGEEHPDTLESLHNLAFFYDDQGRLAKAEPLYQRVLAAYERVRGMEDIDTLRSLNNLAVFYEEQGRLADAEPLFKQALAAYERVRGKEHPYTLKTMNNLADLYVAQGHLAEAEPLAPEVENLGTYAVTPACPQARNSLPS